MSSLRDQLAEYVSHKRVRAGEIVARTPSEGGYDGYLTVLLATGARFITHLNHEQWTRGGHEPKEGDWLVIYGQGEDEYMSISPRKAFEEGYRLTGSMAGGLSYESLKERRPAPGTYIEIETREGESLPDAVKRQHPLLSDAMVSHQDEKLREKFPDGVALTSASHPDINPASLETVEIEVDDRPHDIGWAVRSLRGSIRVRRGGWHDKTMYLTYDPGDGGAYGAVELLPNVTLNLGNGKHIPWTCSQSDLLALDWEIAE